MRLRVVPLLCALLAAAGCGGRGVVPVSGRVTVDGKPAAGVHVGFQPVAAAGNNNPGGGSYAITDDDGRFTLRLVEGGQEGAFVGKHRVEITGRPVAVDDNTDSRIKAPPKKPIVPAKYGRDSALTFEVPGGGTDKADFALTSQ
jgi:hypothetical protein